MVDCISPGEGNFGGGVPSASPNPDPISDQKMPFSTPVIKPGLKKSIPVFRPAFDRLMFVVFVQTGNAFFVD